MQTYRVEWAIDIDADSAREAAEKALVIQRSDSQCITFDVLDEDGEAEHVDLLEDADNRTQDAQIGVEEYLSNQLDLIRVGLRRLQEERFMPLEMRDRLQAEGFSRLDAYGQALDLVRDCMRSEPAEAVKHTFSL
jgi:hypothetical protein